MSPKLLEYYLHTLAHLRPGQIAARAVREARRRLGVPSVWLPPEIGTNPPPCAPLKVRVDFPACHQFDARDIEKYRFTFLNESLEPGSPLDWRCRANSRLFRYHLHCFKYLQAAGAISPARALALINDWIAQNPEGAPDSWDPFPISCRLVNWIKCLSRPELSRYDLGAPLRSAHRQALWLERSLEFDLLGNHLLKNAKALLFCGLFFKDRHARRWLSAGVQLLTRELGEQVLADGGHFERSPLYHAMIVEDCLDLLNVCSELNDRLAAALCRLLLPLLPAMLRFLAAVTHPDGQICLFNDSALGVEASAGELGQYYENLTGRSSPRPLGPAWSFPATGYFVMAPRQGERLFIDCGPVGPDHQPGHSHCDTLSIELSLGGTRVIVDSGCFQYEEGEMRRYNRGNRGHNAVTIDGRNQSQVWGAHRCAKRARPVYGRLDAHPDGTLVFAGAHDGYRRLSGRPVHHRRIVRAASGYLIEDRVEGGGRHEIVSRLHINPELGVVLEGTSARISNREKLVATVHRLGPGTFRKGCGWYAPRFGLKKECVVLESSLTAHLPCRGGWLIEVGNGVAGVRERD